MSALRHTHTYRRSRARNNLYQCTDPACSHYADRKFIVGKLAKCPDCGREYILTPYDLKLATPKCEQCKNLTRGAKDKLNRTRIALKDLFPPAPEPLEEEITKLIQGKDETI